MTETRKKIRVNPMLPDDICAVIAANTWGDSDIGREEQRRLEYRLTHPEAGDKMPDGSLYLGFYGDEDWFVTAEDARDSKGKKLLMDFNTAAAYAKNLKAHGHDDWILPPGGSGVPNKPNILSKMSHHGKTNAFEGTYGNDCNNPTYLSSTLFGVNATGQTFSGAAGSVFGSKDARYLIRCVRSVPRHKP